MMLKSKKSQAAMEFLTTYGWSLLVIVVIIAALITVGVLNSDNLLPDKLDLPPGIAVRDFTINDGEVTLHLMNNMGKNLLDFTVSIDACNNYTGASSDLATFPEDDVIEIIVPCNNIEEGSRLKSDVSISYKSRKYGTEMSHSAAGYLSGTVDGVIRDTTGNATENTTTQGDLGDGSDGALSLSSGSSILNTYAYLQADASSGSTQLSMDTTGFQQDDEVLIIQMQSNSGYGVYEIKRIESVAPNSITLNNPLDNSYTTGNPDSLSAVTSQVVRIPQYNSVNVGPGATIRALGWDGNKGGIIAVKSKTTMVIEGDIDANNIGFRGGSVSATLGPEGPQGYQEHNGGGGAGGTSGNHDCCVCLTCCATPGLGADGSDDGNVGRQTCNDCGGNNGGNALGGGGAGGAGGAYSFGLGGSAVSGGGAGGNKVSDNGYDGATGLTGGGGGGGADRDSAGGAGGGKAMDSVGNLGSASLSVFVLGGGASAGAGGGGGGAAGDHECASGGSGGSKYGTYGARGDGDKKGNNGDDGTKGQRGGGIILIFAATMEINGDLISNGGDGGAGGDGGKAGKKGKRSGGAGGGGSGGNGGSGGSIHLLANELTVSGSISSIAGSGGTGGSGGNSKKAGDGGDGALGSIGDDGRIRFDYYDSRSGTSNPAPYVNQLGEELVPYTAP